MTPGGQGGRRAAAGEAGAADFPEPLQVTDAGASAVGPSGSSRSFWSVHVCRAGFAGRGTTFALLTGRHTLAVPPDPRQGLGSR